MRQLIALMTLVVGALVVVLIVSVASRDSKASSNTQFDGSLLPAGVRAPDFDLRDQDGRRFSMADYRGKPMIVTFLYTHCKDTCPVEARLINQALKEIGKPTAVVAFSVDPPNDTAASVHAFLRKEQITEPMRWGLGTTGQLKPVWKGYAVTPQREDEEHMARIVLIDKRGMQRVGYPFTQTTPARIAHDMKLLAAEVPSS